MRRLRLRIAGYLYWFADRVVMPRPGSPSLLGRLVSPDRRGRASDRSGSDMRRRIAEVLYSLAVKIGGEAFPLERLCRSIEKARAG